MDDMNGFMSFIISLLNSKDPCLRKVCAHCLTSEPEAADQLVGDITTYRDLCTMALDQEDFAIEHLESIEDTRNRLQLILPQAAEYAQAMVDLALRLQDSSDSVQ